MKNVPLIEIIDGVPRHPMYRMKLPVNFCMMPGEQLAIVGPNGGGKSLLVDIIIGRWPLLMNEVKYHFEHSNSDLICDNIRYLTFRDSYGDADSTYYYQQRYHSQDREITPLVRELLPEAIDKEFKVKLFELFGMNNLLDKYIVLLSSGELRKFQLVKALMGKPSILILDNPFIGLDVKTRALLQDLLKRLIETTHLHVILLFSRADEIPDFITHVVPVEDLVCGNKKRRVDYLPTSSSRGNMNTIAFDDFPSCYYLNANDEIVKLNKVSIQYDDRTILKDLDWTVRVGEKWALTGENGSGKSTLLSLICADNPQSYACDISLFGRKRGTGESIWEIKKHIGYVSPEIHRAYLKNIPSIDIVASGLHDSVGLYVRPKPKQRGVCEWWMDVFGIKELKDRSFLQLSSGEQRLVLLARAFVKDPDLLILDEPLHGLDARNRCMVKDIIESFCKRRNKTMIMVSHYQEEFPECITHSLHLKKY